MREYERPMVDVVEFSTNESVMTDVDPELRGSFEID